MNDESFVVEFVDKGKNFLELKVNDKRIVIYYTGNRVFPIGITGETENQEELNYATKNCKLLLEEYF